MLAHQECLETQDWQAPKDLKVMSLYQYASEKNHIVIYALMYGKELLDTGIEERSERNSNKYH